MFPNENKEHTTTQIVSSNIPFKPAHTVDFSAMLSIVVVLLVFCIAALYLSNRSKFFKKNDTVSNQNGWHLKEKVKISDSTNLYIVSDGLTQWPIAESSKNIEILTLVSNRKYEADITNEE